MIFCLLLTGNELCFIKPVYPLVFKTRNLYYLFIIFSVTYFHGRVVKDPTSRKPREAKFAFDRVFGPSATNIEVYEQTTKKVLRALVEGYNCSGTGHRTFSLYTRNSID